MFYIKIGEQGSCFYTNSFHEINTRLAAVSNIVYSNAIIHKGCIRSGYICILVCF